MCLSPFTLREPMPTSTATYDVEDDSQITADVLIGNKQPGGSTISLGTTSLPPGGTSMRDVPIGVGSAIRGKKMVVVSEVEDKNPATDMTSVTVIVKGGEAPKEVTQEQPAAKKNDIVTYVTVIAFT
jgi:hypothetical protein